MPIVGSCFRIRSEQEQLCEKVTAAFSISSQVGPESAAVSDQGPDDPRHAVRERYGDDLQRFTLQHPAKPVIARRAPPLSTDLCHSTEVEQLPQVSVACFGDPPKPFLAAAGMRAWRSAACLS